MRALLPLALLLALSACRTTPKPGGEGDVSGDTGDSTGDDGGDSGATGDDGGDDGGDDTGDTTGDDGGDDTGGGDTGTGDPDEDGDGVPASEDCDDSDPLVFPDAPEVCNDADDDCDGLVDEDDDDLEGATAWYADTDEDGYGDAADFVTACEAPDGYVADATDCDPAVGTTFPGADERCNDVDDDCDTEIDEDAVDGDTWYLDSDEDGFGDADSTASACDRPDGYVADATDCDDSVETTFPGAAETCNDVDDDCDDEIDEGATTTFYADSDDDGYGDADTAVEDCEAPDGYVEDATDCDDGTATTFPGADETCNDVDDDCDDEIDEDPVDGEPWYPDSDGDGYGDEDGGEIACEAPDDYLADGTDCDDATYRTNPGAQEICNEVDDDCDGDIDEDCQDTIIIGAPSEDPLAEVDGPGACAHISEVSASYNVHEIENMDSWMEILEGDAGTLYDETQEVTEVLDWSIRCGSDYSASPGNYDSTTSWPAFDSTGSAGVSRFRGYLHIAEGESIDRTIGLIGNDALDLTIEGTDVMWVNWDDGQWKKFRHVSFPRPGLYAFEVRWSTNLTCEIDPFELVWGDEYIDGYGDYDDMCASAVCEYGDGEEIPGLWVLSDDELTRTTDGSDAECFECEADDDCGTDEVCNSAGLCE